MKISHSQILKARNEIGLISAGDGWTIFNATDESGPELNSMNMSILVNYKALEQIDNILDKLDDLCESLEDFISGDLDKYLDAHSEYAEEGDPAFDPYENITFIIGTDEYDALPKDIEQYAEMLLMLDSASLQRLAMDAAFDKLFKGKLTRHYLVEDEETGESHIIPEDQMDPKLAEEFNMKSEVNKKLRHIELEHCFDNYNDWIAEFRRKIEARDSFEELRAMIGE